MWPQPDDAPPSLAAASETHSEYVPEERKWLLRLAHQSIESALTLIDIPIGSVSDHLSQSRGAFTTIYVNRELRGCVGYVMPVAPLYRTVWETARAAAFSDTRFPAITVDELPNLAVSLSILSSLTPISAEEIEIGRHGLVVAHEGHRGLLLPQVPGEHGWDRVTFLEQTCRKAGLPANAWQRGAKLEAFTAELFGDRPDLV